MTEIQKIERLRSPFYKAYAQQWNKLLFQNSIPYLTALKDTTSISTLETIPIDYKEIRELFLRMWILTGRTFANVTRNENKKSVSCAIHTKSIEDDFFDKYMYNFAETEAGQRIISIGQTNKDAILKVIRQALLEGEQQGMGADEMAKYIQDKLKSEIHIISRYSAERIARTEIVGASNRGQLIGAQSLGYNMTKTWIPFFDSRTRTFEKGQYNHAFQETVGLYDKFTGTGQFGGIDHPGDPKGEAGNVINCRCTCGYKVL